MDELLLEMLIATLWSEMHTKTMQEHLRGMISLLTHSGNSLVAVVELWH